VLQVRFPAGGDGKMGVEVQVGHDFHSLSPYHKFRARAKLSPPGFKTNKDKGC
jgi:hypothetical protein